MMVAHFRRFRMPEAVALREIEEAEAELAAAPNDKARLEAHIRAGFHLIPLNREAEAVVHFEAALPISRALSDHAQEIETLLHLATARQYLGQREGAMTIFAEALSKAESYNADAQVHFLLHHRGRCEVEMGRVAQARESFEKSLALRERMGEHLFVASSQAALKDLEGL